MILSAYLGLGILESLRDKYPQLTMITKAGTEVSGACTDAVLILSRFNPSLRSVYLPIHEADYLALPAEFLLAARLSLFPGGFRWRDELTGMVYTFYQRGPETRTILHFDVDSSLGSKVHGLQSVLTPKGKRVFAFPVSSEVLILCRVRKRK